MRNLKLTALALCATVAMGASAANAAEASADTCMSMQSQVKAAVASNQQSPNLAAAMKESGYGRDFCNNAMYKNGISHYAQALKLLGQS
ncbi:MAG TPA: hypothetical protein VIJ85_08145 [Rhizomicrobium sp.]